MRIDIMDNLQRSKETNQLHNNLSASQKIEQKLKDAENVAKEFETLYLDMLVKSMRQTAKAEDESNAHEIFQSMLDGEYAKLMADSQSYGIRDLILNWMKENDPSLNSNIKILNKNNKEQYQNTNNLQNTHDTLEKMKNDSYISKLAIEQYKIEMGNK